MRFCETLLITLAFACSPVSVGNGANGQSSASITRVKLSPDQTEHLLAQISNTLSGLTSLQADFVQERRMAAFADALVAKGTMYFQAPDKIRWELREPYQSALVFNGGRIAKVIYDKGQPRKLKVGSQEIIKEVLRFISLWIQGDFKSSKQLFDLRIEQVCAATPLSRTDEHAERTCDFILTFTPRAKEMTDRIRSIELAMDGDSKHINQVTIHENQGDRITIRFENRECDVELAKALFVLD